MHIFIDESGSFSDFSKGSISAVGGLVIPHCQLRIVEKKYAKMRPRLLKNGNTEVKGRLLNESEIDAVVALLIKNQAIFECAFVDFGLMEEADVSEGKAAHADYLFNLAKTINPDSKEMVLSAAQFIAKSKINQYIQALATFRVLQGIFYVAPLYFSTRQPKELADFEWVVDGKNKTKTDEWEMWWSAYAPGALSTMSIRHPRPEIPGADYSHMARYNATFKEKDGSEAEGTDMNLVLKNLRFSSLPEAGLELVDILVNATRRALVGNLQLPGYRGIRELMLHRKDDAALRLSNFTHRDDKAGWQEVRAPWVPVAKFFIAQGRTMFTEKIIRRAYEAEQAEKNK